MNGDSVARFMRASGRELPNSFHPADEATRKLGAQLLLSELLEYIIKGLGLTPVINGQRVTDSEGLAFEVRTGVDARESLDGLADVAYTMYWNAHALGLPLEEAFSLVCQNNLEKFVKLDRAAFTPGTLPRERWDCGLGVIWPSEVTHVSAVAVEHELYAVGRDKTGKVRKPSTYRSVDLSPLLR